MDNRNRRLVITGDPKVGKTWLLSYHKNGKCPSQSEYREVEQVCQEDVWTIIDTYGSEEEDHARMVAYVCSVVDRNSFENVSYKWIREWRHNSPGAPFILVGTKSDLRTDQPTLDNLAEKKILPVSYEEGIKLAEELGAYTYIETSAVMGANVKEAFDMALESLDPQGNGAIKPPKPPKPSEPEVRTEDLPVNEALRKFIGKKEFSDVTLIAKDNREIPAHKIILACSMPSLQQYFLKNNGELPEGFKVRETSQNGKTEQLVIGVDMEYEVLNCILYSIYTGYQAYGRDFTAEIAQKAYDFFVKYPRFSLEERCKVMAELALNENPPFADVTFEVRGKRRVLAHKVPLGAVSEYFNVIFTSGMKESQMDVIPLRDVEEDELTVIKEYLYSGTANSLNANNVANIIGFANKFNMAELLSYCEMTCKENIDSFDLYDLYQLALAHNCKQLDRYTIWQMKIQYDNIKDEGWFKKQLDKEIRQRVEEGQWPGQTYHNLVKVWEQKQGKKKGGKNKDKDKNCSVM